MAYERTIEAIRGALGSVFADLDAWLDRSERLRRFRPASGGWSIEQVLEHVTLTNRFLLLTAAKWAAIAEHRARRGDAIPNGESDLDRLLVIGERGSFGWRRPQHMEPSGLPTAAEIRLTLLAQSAECLSLLERLRGGVGALCRVTMTVNALGKIDLYQWLFFLAQHARRHQQQMAAVDAEFMAIGSSDAR